MQTYALVENGAVVNTVVWDGSPGWAPAAGVSAILVTAATGPASAGWAYANGAFVAPAVAPFVVTLADAQATQTSLLSAACAAAIVAGFQSSALGVPYTYPSKATDQANLSASVISALLAAAAAMPWMADTVLSAGQIVATGGQLYTCVASGPTGSAAPVWPTTAGQIANDGGAQWQLWTTPFWCEDAVGNWAFVNHTSPQIQKVGVDAKQAILANMAANVLLSTQVAEAETVAAVQAIVWP